MSQIPNNESISETGFLTHDKDEHDKYHQDDEVVAWYLAKHTIRSCNNINLLSLSHVINFKNIHAPNSLENIIDVSKLTFGAEIKNNNTKFKPLYYDNKPFTLQIPVLTSPYSVFHDSITLSFKDIHKHTSHQTLYGIMSTLDTQVTHMLAQKQLHYKPIITLYKDKDTGEITDKYPPTFKLKVPVNCEVYNAKEDRINISDIDTKSAKITGVLKFVGIWIAGRHCGIGIHAEKINILS